LAAWEILRKFSKNLARGACRRGNGQRQGPWPFLDYSTGLFPGLFHRGPVTVRLPACWYNACL
jgi:hypothetical protein